MVVRRAVLAIAAAGALALAACGGADPEPAPVEAAGGDGANGPPVATREGGER